MTATAETAEDALPDLPPKGSMSWDGQTLVVDPDEPMFKAVTRKALSASTSNALQDCPTRWFVEKLVPRDDDPFAAMHVGTAAHAVLEDLFDRPFNKRTPADAHELLLTITDRHEDLAIPTDPLDLARWRDQVMLALGGLWDIEDPSQVVPGQREQHLDQVSVRGVPLTGFVDRVDPVVTDEGDLSQKIVDYKTGKWSSQSTLKMFGDDYAEQMRLYALALQELTGRLPAEAELYYTKVGKKRAVPLGPRLLDKTAERFVDSWEKHNEYTSTGRWPTKASGLCNFCPLATVCPSAATRDKPIEPRNDTYRYGEAMLDPLEDEVVEQEPDESPEPAPQEPSDEDYPPPAEPPDEYSLGIRDDEPVVHEPAARHTHQVHTDPHEESNTMPAKNGPWSGAEDKAWEEVVGDDVQAGSYAATAVFGIAAMAVEELHKASQPITGNNVQSLALTLSSLVLEVQTELTGNANFQRSLNTRLRGAMHAALLTMPIPFGESDEAWDQWAQGIKRRIKSVALVAHKVWDTGVVDRPYAALVNSTTPRPTNQNSEVSA